MQKKLKTLSGIFGELFVNLWYKKSPNGGYQSAYVSNRFSVLSNFKYIWIGIIFYHSLKVLGEDLEFRLLSLLLIGTASLHNFIWYGSVWSELALYDMVCVYCLDVLPCQVWNSWLQKWLSYTHFINIWFGLVC